MNYQCPGQDRRNIKAEIISCCYCGYGVEIFSDETRIKCPQCKGWVNRKILPSCVAWCKSARECVGEKMWEQLTKGG